MSGLHSSGQVLTPCSSLGESGLAFFALGLGMVIGTATQPLFIRNIRDKGIKAGGKAPPEARLPVGMAGAVVAPLGLLWFALSSFRKMPWIMPMIGTLIFGVGVSRPRMSAPKPLDTSLTP